MRVIQWYPGHMAKAKREVTEALTKVDLIIELLDARIPLASKNPMLDEIVHAKPRLILLCKSSLADPKWTKEWVEYLSKGDTLALDIDSITGYNMSKVVPQANKALQNVFKKRESKGIKSKRIKAMIVGIPNVGKSTLINVVGKRKAVAVGDKPGVTKAQTWIKVTDDFLLLDTPGILWPKFDDQMVGVKLAICGSIKEDILNLNEISRAALELIKENYPNAIGERFAIPDADKLSTDELIEAIGRKRGVIGKGNIVDIARVEYIFLTELQKGKLGAITYEYPEKE